MGFRFKKSLKLGKHFRINLSKSGVGYSIGGKGIRYTRSASGRKTVTTSIPGTGLSYSTNIGKKKTSSVGKKNTSRQTMPQKQSPSTVKTNAIAKETSMPNYKKKSSAKTAVATIAGIFAAGSILGAVIDDPEPVDPVDDSLDSSYTETLPEEETLQSLSSDPLDPPLTEDLEPSFPDIDVSVQSEQAMADDLKALGLFKGVSDTDYALDRAPTRIEAVVMLLRVLGKETEVLNAGYSHPFTDVPEWANAYIGYAYETGLAQGVSETEFGSGNASAAMYLTLVLRSLGYSDADGRDFTWDDPYTLASEIGVLHERVDTENFMRGDVVTISHAALSAKPNGSDEPFSRQLIDTNLFTAEEFSDIYYTIEEIYVPEPEIIETLLVPEPTDDVIEEVLPTTELIAEPTPEPVTEPVPEAIAEPVPEPVAEPVPEPVIEPEPVWTAPVYTEPEPSYEDTGNSEAEAEVGQVLYLVRVTSPVARNETATLSAVGKPYTEYDIDVYYSSGASTADGLENKTSDESGNVSWSWKVGGRTKSGDHKIVVVGGGERLETSFTTTE